jgi:BMFP domain-containing protein YqiC
MQDEAPNIPQRISFDADKIKPSRVVKDTKVDVSKSRFAKQTKVKEQFEERAAQTHESLEGNKSRAAEVGREFWSFFGQKVLPENKGPLEKSFEREIISKLINYAIDINNDEFEQKDGMGSVSMITLLLNAVIKLRDRCNELEYKVEQHEKKLAKHVEMAEKSSDE